MLQRRRRPAEPRAHGRRTSRGQPVGIAQGLEGGITGAVDEHGHGDPAANGSVVPQAAGEEQACGTEGEQEAGTEQDPARRLQSWWGNGLKPVAGGGGQQGWRGLPNRARPITFTPRHTHGA